MSSESAVVNAERLRFEIPAAIKRVDKEGDLFEPVLKTRQRLPEFPAADASGTPAMAQSTTRTDARRANNSAPSSLSGD